MSKSKAALSIKKIDALIDALCRTPKDFSKFKTTLNNFSVDIYPSKVALKNFEQKYMALVWQILKGNTLDLIVTLVLQDLNQTRIQNPFKPL